MPKQRIREKFVFWLTVSKDDELLLAEQIDQLKQRRRFLPTIRDGIRLVVDLRRGRVDVLCELFPWVSEIFAPPTASAEFEQMMRRLIEQGSPQAPVPPGPKRIEAPQFAAPAPDDDDEFDLDIRAVQGGVSGQNFVSSVMALSGG